MRFIKAMRAFYLTIGIVLLLHGSVDAQSFSDNALLFSRTNPIGSARVQALGGPHASIGGDYSAGLSNPAGLGMYNRSELALSVGTSTNTVSSNYFDKNSSQTNTKFNVPGFSLVLHFADDRERPSGFLGGSLGISLYRVNDLNQRYSYGATNSQSSIIDYFIEDANYRAPNDPADLLRGGSEFYSLSALAYNNYLIDTFHVDGRMAGYGSVLSRDPNYPDEVRKVDQLESITRKGAQYQWAISYGANFSDKLFVGATLGLTTIRYKVTQVFQESNYQFISAANYNSPVRSVNMQENIDISGGGANLTIGAIYRPVNFFQFGASLVTPTYQQLTDNYTATMSSDWVSDDDVQIGFDQPLLSQYNLRTPLRLSGGATFISKYGFITGTMELVNYGKAKYTAGANDNSDYSYDNQDIKSSFGRAINYRIGAELRYDIFRLRGGYSSMGDPNYPGTSFLSSLTRGTTHGTIQNFSVGAGVRLKSFFIDAAYVLSKTNAKRIPYSASNVPDPVVNQKITNNNIVVTAGFTF